MIELINLTFNYSLIDQVPILSFSTFISVDFLNPPVL